MHRISSKNLSKLAALFLAIMLALPATTWAATGNPNAKPGASAPDYSFHMLQDVEIPMRDGVITRANIWLPDGAGPWPTVLTVSPYGNTNPTAGELYASHGYAYVARDTRGRYTSDGLFEVPNITEHNDQYDTMDWIVGQTWADGKVAVTGASQIGQTTLAAVFSGHPNLVCAIPVVTAENLWREWYYRNGAMELGFLAYWAGQTFARNDADRLLDDAAFSVYEEILALYSIDQAYYIENLPVIDFEPSAISEDYNLFKLWASNPTLDEYWRLLNPETYISSINVPVMHTGGWYDIFGNGPVMAYINAKNSAYTKFARDNQYLVMGPWTHMTYQQVDTEAAINAFGQGISSLDYYNDVLFAFLDYWMKDLQHPDFDPNTHVLYYTLGDGGKWTWAPDWPLSNVQETAYYLNNGKSGTVNSLNDGTLSTSPSPAGAAPLTYVYDPMSPIPSLGGNVLFQFAYGPDGASAAGPVEQTPVDRRSLTFTSQPLSAPLEIAGKVIAVLYASTDAVDTDWVVRLNDVAPDGTSINVVDGILRARYRDSPHNPTLLTPGQIHEYEIDLWSSSYVFKEGHSLRVTVNSSSFPRWSRNLNVAEFPEQTAEWKVANNTIYLDPEHPSQIILPVMSK